MTRPSRSRTSIAITRCISRCCVAILDGSAEIATPAFIGTLAICIVFFPVVLLYGVARFLFTPLALAVVYSMLTSYLLSRTLVPAMARYLMPATHEEAVGNGLWSRFVSGFDRRFERFRDGYRELLGGFIARRAFGLTCVAILIGSSFFLGPVVGQDFFPDGRRRHVEDASARTQRHASRGDRAHRR